ncbi:hypothetical protein EV424DRAFT_1326827, partial [Suillus variegatus]
GFSVLIFIGTIWIFTYKCRMQDTNRPNIVVATLLFLLSTVYMIICIIYIENRLVKYRNTFLGSPVVHFADLLQPIFVVKNAILVLQTLLSDGVVVSLFFIYQLDIRLSVCSNFVFKCLVSESVWSTACPNWLTILQFFSFTMATNLLSSGSLVYRVWTIKCNVSATCAMKNEKPILHVLVDAAILYSVAVCSLLISFVCFSSGTYVMANLGIQSVIPIILIAFYMVFICIVVSQNNQTYVPMVCGVITETERRNSHYPSVQPLHTIRLHKQNSNTSL